MRKDALCGLPDCDCDYTIGRLLKLLKQAEAIISQADRCRVGKFWLPNYLAGVRYAIAEVEKGQVK